MSLTFVGLGLFDEKDISLKGLERAKEADVIFAEFYTSKLFGAKKEDFEELFERELRVLSREEVEQQQKPLELAHENDVVFLVPGDPMISTTHTDLRIKAMENAIETQIIHASSIFTAAPGLSGLQNYKFGRSATVTFLSRGEVAESPYNAIKQNKENGLHTLLFLDINEEKNRYMAPNRALELLLKIEEGRQEEVIGRENLAVVVSRAGSDDVEVKVGEVNDLLEFEFGEPLHSLIIPGELHFREEEALRAIRKG
ncbi:diphthine synthase [archaeon SCG-AAA382B04]|nr:diphthine synthase [archaeon SCG-AAA382B04]